MKKLTFMLCSMLLCMLYCNASETPVANAQIKSIELNYINGQPGFQLELEIKEDLFITAEPKFSLPAGWTAFSYTHIKGIRCVKGQYFGIYVVLNHPVSNLPFYPQSFSAIIPVAAVSDTSRKDLAPAYGKVYFTPYNTVEIWSKADFYHLKRVWLTEQSAVNPQRIYVPKASIPISDRPDSDTLEAWEDDYTLKRIEGLAYSIPMRAKHADSIAMYNNDDLPVGVDPDSLYEEVESTGSRMQAAAFKIKIKLRHRYQGTVSGRLMTHIIDDFGQPQTIPLAGINVLLKEYDWYANETFGEVHTDENGYFSFTYDEYQSIGEGKNITLFLKYKSRNGNFDIKVKEHAVLGGSQEAHTWLGDFGQSVSYNAGEIILEDDYFRPLHWAVKSFLFCQRNGASLSPDLTILPHKKASYFLPDGTSGYSSPFNRPTIYLMTEDCQHENTIYHEFGHFFMWNIQNKNYVVPVAETKDGEHSWSKENTSRLAWWEGWADALQMILDAAYRDEDQEYGYDEKSYSNSNGSYYESRRNFSAINNGLLSEYYIACAIYDLWDGANKGLPAVLPGSTLQNPIHGFNDRISANWQTDDNIELSFSQIMMPLKLNPFTPIDNIYTYYSVLLNQVIGNNCTLKADIARCFRENDVVYNINMDDYGINTGMSSDGVQVSITKQTIGQLLFVGTVIPYLNTYQINPEGNINFPIKSTSNPFITDYINIKPAPNKPAPEWSFNKGASGGNLSMGTIATCGGTDIDVTNGRLVLGGGGYAAALTIQSASVVTCYYPSEILVNPNSAFIITSQGLLDIRNSGKLLLESGNITIKQGGTLYIRSGGILELKGTATITVEPGAFICVDPNATLSFTSSNQFILQAGAIIGTNPAVATSGNCRTDFCPTGVAAGAEALRFDGADDLVEVAQSGILNLGATAFTMEAIIQSSRTNPNGNIQVILSNRTSGLGDGFMFGLWSDGHLWAQMRGTPNIGFDQGPTILDGNCHHVAISRSTTNILSFYIDGVLTHQQVIPVRDISTNGNLRIGMDGPSGLPFEGLIGKVRIWNVERTAFQIQSNITQNLSAQVGLVALWDMNGSGQLLPDLSGNANQGALGLTQACDPTDPVWVAGTALACSSGGNFRLAADTETNSAPVITAYPNPFNTNLTVSFIAGSGLMRITVTDEKGLLVFVKDNCTTVEVLTFGEELAPGMYFMQVTGSSEINVLKLVKIQ